MCTNIFKTNTFMVYSAYCTIKKAILIHFC